MNFIEKRIQTSIFANSSSNYIKLNDHDIRNDNTIFQFDNVFNEENTFKNMYDQSVRKCFQEFYQGENATFFLYGNADKHIEEFFLKVLSEFFEEVFNSNIQIQVSILSFEKSGIYDKLSNENRSLTIKEVMGVIMPFDLELIRINDLISATNIIGSIKSKLHKDQHIIYQITDINQKNNIRLVMMKCTKNNHHDFLALQNISKIIIEKKKQEQTKKIPYRLSKLSHYLKDSFEGNNKSLFFAIIGSDDGENSFDIVTLLANLKEIINVRKFSQTNDYVNCIFEVKFIFIQIKKKDILIIQQFQEYFCILS